MKKSNAATIVSEGKKFYLDNDAIVNITLKSDVVYEEVRVVGINMMGDGIRVVGKDGINEIPTKLIKNITDCGKTEYPGVTVRPAK
jgi:hypothetical protein